MPPFILVTDRGPEPYRPPKLAPKVKPTTEASEAGRVADQDSQPRGQEFSQAKQAYKKPAPPRRKPAVLAEQVMTREPVALPPSATADDAWAIIRDRRIIHIPIVAENGHVVGLISDRDLIQNPKTRLIRNLMRKKVIVATGDTPIRDIARILVDERIGCVPIVDAEHGLIGMITRTDVLRCVINRAPLDLWI